MTKDEALNGLKHLKTIAEQLKTYSDQGQYLNIPSHLSAGNCWWMAKEIENVINACEKALEQPAQDKKITGQCIYCRAFNGHLDGCIYEKSEQPAQEPVAWVWVMEHEGAYRIFATEEQANEFMCGYAPAVSGDVIVIRRKVYGYTHPHQWQGLTDDDVKAIEEVLGIDKVYIRAIERTLKEKNGY